MKIAPITIQHDGFSRISIEKERKSIPFRVIYATKQINFRHRRARIEFMQTCQLNQFRSRKCYDFLFVFRAITNAWKHLHSMLSFNFDVFINQCDALRIQFDLRTTNLLWNLVFCVCEYVIQPIACYACMQFTHLMPNRTNRKTLRRRQREVNATIRVSQLCMNAYMPLWCVCIG